MTLLWRTRFRLEEEEQRSGPVSTSYYSAEDDWIEDETETVEVELYIEDAGWVRPKEAELCVALGSRTLYP